MLINSSFEGASLSFFGSIEPDEFESEANGPYNVIIVVTGPREHRIARLKTNEFLIWSNTDSVTFQYFPSFYAVISSGKLEMIANEGVLEEYRIRPVDQAHDAALASGLRAKGFGAELVRLMHQEGNLQVRDDGIRFLSARAYVANLSLQSGVANGPFSVRTLVFKHRILLADHLESFSVRKGGFENFVFVASRQQPLLYGLACVVLALSTGWLASAVFKR